MSTAPEAPAASAVQTGASSARRTLQDLERHLNQQIVGQPGLIDRLLVCLLSDGHLLVEGAPGLAKTTAIKTLAGCVEARWQRVQFTPDLLPSDLLGTEVYRPETGDFPFRPGPIFHNLVLADEINRAPAKVQSALLEAMAERQVTVGGHTHRLPELFLVMATQNPIEHEGTYPLPEAQLDRFLMHVRVDAPDARTERQVLHLVRDRVGGRRQEAFPPLPQEVLLRARREVLDVHLSEPLEEYLVQLTVATRQAARWSEDAGRWIEWGASPRATLALDRCARAHAWLAGRDYVTPEDVLGVAPDVLRHRLVLSFAAQSAGIEPDRVVRSLLDTVPLP
jgi:MoxR-like ATPase